MNSDSHSTDHTSEQAWQLLPSLLAAISEPDVTPEQATTGLLGKLIEQSGATAAGTVRQTGRDWMVTAWAGSERSQPVPDALVAEAIDRGHTQQQADWLVIPITAPLAAAADPTILTRLPQALILQTSKPQEAKTQEITAWGQAAADLLTDFGALLLRLCDFRQRSRRLEAMLDFAAQWHQEDDPEALLHAIANAATELLQSERASIFLWDRARKKLVGKPALGVGKQPLEVDDSAGVVGAVLQSGQPRRWQASEDEESEINRAVDRKLQFVTRSLLAVPLHDQAGKPAGVFEVINKKQGAFSREDIDTLTRLAGQAAGVIRNTQDRHTAIKTRDRLIADVAEGVQIIGQSEGIVTLRKSIQRVAATDLSLLILGENGTGKEVLARSVHFQSPRRSEPFVAVNCAALVETLLESELFGHEKGAFTDAHQSRPGKFELAHGGTLFLDEIGDMSLGGQAKLLRVLEEKVIVRVGGSTPIPVDVRVVAATNQPLAGMVREKTFREDLYFRLNVVSLQLPPLRERGDDILLLAKHFLSDFAKQIGRLPPQLSKDAAAAMRRHAWPGNIRELRNLMERVSYLCPADTIEADDLSFSADPRSPPENGLDTQSALTLGLTEATRRYQIQAIEQAIASCQGNMTDAAARLGLHRSNLYRKLKQLGMEE